MKGYANARDGKAKPMLGEIPTLTIPIGASLAEIEELVIFATLQHLGGHKTQTAKVLGVSLKTLYNRLNLYAQEARFGR
jgi:hypothetical protein